MPGFIRNNSLGLAFGLLFLVTLVAQALVGHADFNHSQVAHHGEAVSLVRYVTSSEYGVDVLENWQSEYLQFTLFILATVWLLQRGSPESKPLDQARRRIRQGPAHRPLLDRAIAEVGPRGRPADAIYSNSLVLVMGGIWIASWGGQAITGRIAYNADQLDHQEAAVSLVEYLGSADFWNRTLQNWQSEFLAVGSMAVLAIYLRQRGSPESKPVGAPHEATGVES